MDPLDFLGALYDDSRMAGGVVELRNISHADEAIWRAFCGDPLSLKHSITEFSRRPGKHGTYFGVALRKRGSQKGTKRDVHALPALWADIDVAKLGWDQGRTVQALKQSPIRPSVVVNSGYGLHLYWVLTDPIVLPDDYEEARPLIGEAEDTMRGLAAMFGGDNTVDVTRVLRVPGTLNMKEEKSKPVSVVFGDWNTYALEELVADPTKSFALDNGEWLDAKVQRERAKKHKRVSSIYETISSTSKIRTTPLGIDSLFSRTKLGGGQGLYGLDEAMSIGLAKLYSAHSGEWTDEQIIGSVLRRVEAIHKRDAPHVAFDTTKEWEKAADKLERWKLKLEEYERDKNAGRHRRRG